MNIIVEYGLIFVVGAIVAIITVRIFIGKDYIRLPVMADDLSCKKTVN